MTGGELTVLIVDDDYRVGMVHQGFVERTPGFRVVGQARTAAEARSSIATLRPDVVLLDIYLPDGDGLEVLRELSEDPESPDVIVISAASDIDSVRGALRLGAVHYVVKPFGFDALRQRLESIRQANDQVQDWPADATQHDVDLLFRALRSDAGREPAPEPGGLAPTLQLVLDAIADSAESLSASAIAGRIGVSRATAQRCLAQLEQTGLIGLQLRYGATGRPEHRYTLRRR